MAMTALLLSSLPACATTSPDEATAEGCGTERLGGLVGRARAAESEAEALRLSGAARLRWIRPGDVVTMDYSTTRLNAYLDNAGRIQRFTCG
jgi:translation initiation factor IF-1